MAKGGWLANWLGAILLKDQVMPGFPATHKQTKPAYGAERIGADRIGSEQKGKNTLNLIIKKAGKMQ